MSISNVVFLIPIHPPYYHYVYRLLTKLKIENIIIKVILIFSSQSDLDKFAMKSDIESMLIDSLPADRRSIAVYKKFYGLKQMIDRDYDYIICCDGETDIIPQHFTNENIHEKIAAIFRNKKIYAGETTGNKLIKQINEVSASIFVETETLKSLTKDFSLYSFWSDLPVYRKSDLLPFFDLINYKENVKNISWYHFEQVMYHYYLLLRCGFELVNITPVTKRQHSLEDFGELDELSKDFLTEMGFGFSWVTKGSFLRNRDYLMTKNVFLIFHLDR